MMKKNIIILFLCFVGMAQAQNKWSYGAKLGMNISTIKGEDADLANEVDPLIGFNAGAFLNYKITDKLSVQPELLGSYQGAHVVAERVISGVNVKVDDNIKMSYLLVPVMVQYDFYDKFYVEAGPQLGVNLTKDVLISGVADVVGSEINVDERIDDLRRLDFALNAGIGYRINQHFFANARFSRSFLSIDNRENGRDFKNQVISINLGYAL